MARGVIRTRGLRDALGIRVGLFVTPTTPEQQLLARQVLVELRSQLEANDAGALELVRDLEAAGVGDPDLPARGLSRFSSEFVTALLARLERDFATGRLRVDAEPRRPLPDVPDPLPELPP